MSENIYKVHEPNWYEFKSLANFINTIEADGFSEDGVCVVSLIEVHTCTCRFLQFVES